MLLPTGSQQFCNKQCALLFATKLLKVMGSQAWHYWEATEPLGGRPSRGSLSHWRHGSWKAFLKRVLLEKSECSVAQAPCFLPHHVILSTQPQWGLYHSQHHAIQTLQPPKHCYPNKLSAPLLSSLFWVFHIRNENPSRYIN